MMEKVNTLSLGEKLVAGGGILMLIASFLPWWHYSESIISISRNGWGLPGSFWSVLAILISLALAAVIIAIRFGNVKMPDLPENVTWGKVFGGAGGALIILMLLKAWRITAAPAGSFGIGFFIG